MADNSAAERIEYIGQDRDKGYYPDRKLLGAGSFNTEVYQGFFQKRPAAVKKIRKDLAQEFAKRETGILCDGEAPLENVVTCYWASLDDNPQDKYHYLILELCAATLEDFIAGKYSRPMPSDRQVLYQICNGIAAVHGRGIAHKDLRPQNILISTPNDRGHVTMKMSDFGLSRQTFHREVTNTNNKGALGWVAPEINAKAKGHKVNFITADIFSLGCVLHYFITRGQHPFGEVHYKRQSNIDKGKRTIDPMIIDYTTACAIEAMTEHEAAKRPSINQVLLHPFLWSPERTIKFLGDVSNYLEPSRKKGATADLQQMAADLELGAQDITGGDWLQALAPKVQQYMHQYLNQMKVLKRDPTYSTKVINLLRVIRNLRPDGHYHELSADAKTELGDPESEEFCQDWTGRFPKLLKHTYDLMKNCPNPQFCKFYQEQEDRSQVISPPRSMSDITTITDTQQNDMQAGDVQPMPEPPFMISTPVSASEALETIVQRLQRLSFGKAGGSLLEQPASDTADVPATLLDTFINDSTQEGGNGDATGSRTNSEEPIPREEFAAEVKKEVLAHPEALKSTAKAASKTELVARNAVLPASPVPFVKDMQAYVTRRAFSSSVKLVASNPVTFRHVAFALKDGSIVFNQFKGESVILQGPTGNISATTSLVWNGSGTWLAAGDSCGKVKLWNWPARVAKSENFSGRQVISMQWSHLGEKDVIQIIFHNKFYAMGTTAQPVGEFPFLHNCSMCSDWNGSNQFAVTVAKTYAIDVYQINLGNKEVPLTRIATLPGFQKVYVSAIRWNAENPTWIAVGYKTGQIRVWNLTDNSIAQLPASPVEVHGLEWMLSGSRDPGMLASCSKDNAVRVYAFGRNWECAKTFCFSNFISRMKYCREAETLFVSSFNKELRMINAKLEESLAHAAKHPVRHFDLGGLEGDVFAAVIGDEEGLMTFVKMKIKSLLFVDSAYATAARNLTFV